MVGFVPGGMVVDSNSALTAHAMKSSSSFVTVVVTVVVRRSSARPPARSLSCSLAKTPVRWFDPRAKTTREHENTETRVLDNDTAEAARTSHVSQRQPAPLSVATTSPPPACGPDLYGDAQTAVGVERPGRGEFMCHTFSPAAPEVGHGANRQDKRVQKKEQ